MKILSVFLRQRCREIWREIFRVRRFPGFGYPKRRMQLFCLKLEASCLQLSFFAYSCVWELFCLQFELFCLQLSFFAYSGKGHLTSTSTDRKQRSSTVTKKAPTVSKNASPENVTEDVFDSSRISLVFQCFLHLIGEKVSENQKGEKAPPKKTKNTLPIFFCPLCLPFLLFMFYFFLSLFLSLSFFHYFFSLSFFLSSLSLAGRKKITKITEIIENHQKHQNHRKSTKSSKNP